MQKLLRLHLSNYINFFFDWSYLLVVFLETTKNTIRTTIMTVRAVATLEPT